MKRTFYDVERWVGGHYQCTLGGPYTSYRGAARQVLWEAFQDHPPGSSIRIIAFEAEEEPCKSPTATEK